MIPSSSRSPRPRYSPWKVWATLAVVLLVALGVAGSFWRFRAVEGVVVDETGQPVAAATVRIKAEPWTTKTDSLGRFRLEGFSPRVRGRVTGWADGFYVGGADAWPWRARVEIRLRPYPLDNDSAYAWMPPAMPERTRAENTAIGIALGSAAALSVEHAFLPLSERLTLGCRDCHGQVIYDEWASGAHSLGSSNPIFMALYNGTDATGARGSGIRVGASPYYYNQQILPPADAADQGPGFRLDFPEATGNCGACHLPSIAVDGPYSADPNEATGIDALGSHCDFCHKIADVLLDPDTGLPPENLPGVLSIQVARPRSGEQVFFGPYDDVDLGPDTYLPLMKQSQICAPCHTASFWQVPIYQSFAEWLASPYSDPASGQTCQDCHMRPNGMTTNFAPGRGGLQRDPTTIPTHIFPGAADPALLEGAVSLTVTIRRSASTVAVDVQIANDNTGHHIPTDSPLRQMILLVEAQTESGTPLPQQSGSTLPDWTGVGDPNEGYLAGLPGQSYAKILEDLWTGDLPAASYWNPTRIVSDNRIPALGSDTTTYTFFAPGAEPICVRVRLLFRRVFIELADRKGWRITDIPMQDISLPASCG